jgi:hypothetical protein
MAEFELFGLYQRINGVPDFEDRNAARFDGGLWKSNTDSLIAMFMAWEWHSL